MPSISIAATKSTPWVEYSRETNTLSIIGESYPEDAAKFYRPILEWLESHLETKPEPFRLMLFVRYLNTSSSKCVMTILDTLEKAHDTGLDVSAVWKYEQENEMALECGEEFGEDLSLPFTIEISTGYSSG